MAIMVKGGISGVYNMKLSNKGDEMILLGMNDRNYLNPMASDVL